MTGSNMRKTMTVAGVKMVSTITASEMLFGHEKHEVDADKNRRKVLRWMKNKKLKGIKIGKEYWLTKESVQQLITTIKEEIA